MADLVLLHSADPNALFADAAAPFCASGRLTERLPLLAVRQGGIRDQLQERAARAGCAGWLGAPVVVFAELPALLAGDLAPLTGFERRVLLEQLLARVPLRSLGRSRHQRGVVDALDRLFGDLVSERVAPGQLILRASSRGAQDLWEDARDEDVAALYAAYLDALAALPPVDGTPRSDGRDGRTLAAEAIQARPDEVRRRLRRPFGVVGEPVTVSIYGLNDLRRGWDHLLDALRAAPFVDEVRVYLPLDEVEGADAAAEREALEAIGEFELLDALLDRHPDRVEHVAASDRSSNALASLRGTLFRMGAAAELHTAATPVHALAAPDMARELDEVARRVKRLIVVDGVAPHDIAIVSRKSRPYGPRAAEVMQRHGVPVSARLRSNLTEVSAVAALLRVFAAAAEGFSWRTLAELAESPYFALELDVGLLKRASTRGRYRSLDGWSVALAAMLAAALHYEAADVARTERHGPDAARVRHAMASFAAFREVAATFAITRSRAEWIALALRCVGRDATVQSEAFRDGLWGFCRNVCCPPHSESDTLAVDAARRDAEALTCLIGLLSEWRSALPLGEGTADESLSPSAWYTELRDALDDVEVTLSTPHRRGVQVVEASAAVWRGFEHLFLVGMSAGDFPAEPAGRELFAEHEREARHSAGLPIEPARVWFAREASLLRMLVSATRGSLHVSYAYADASGATQIPSAYFDEIVSRFTSPDADRADAWVVRQPGSYVAPTTLDDVWCVDDLERFAARHWSSDAPDRRADAELALAQLAGDTERSALVRRVLAAAGIEHDRRALRMTKPTNRAGAVRAWNGAVTSPDLLAHLDACFGDSVWSASQLEMYGGCPFTFFLRHVLGVRSLDEPDEDMDGATRGSLLHVCLERLHRQLAANLGDAAFTSASETRAARLIPDIVRRALDEFEATGRGGVRALHGWRERELTSTVVAYLRWEISENEKELRRATPRRRPLHTEVTFGMNGAPPVSLHSGGRVLRLRGTIDRVDELTDAEVRGWRYVVDHKTSDASLTPLDLYEEGALLQLPLYVRALERLEGDGARVWGGAYQIVKGDCKRSAALHPRTLTKGKVRESSNKTEQEAASRLHDSVAVALHHVDGVRGGQFPARIPKCAKGCPTFCEVKDVCREDRPVRGGPRR